MRLQRGSIASAAFVALALSACGDELQRPLGEPREDEGLAYTVEEPVNSAPRSVDVFYGLPRDGQQSIADVLALLPSSRIDRDEPDMFVAPGATPPTDQCQGGRPEELSELPITVEAIVSLQPSKYLKLPICGQDERFYGAYAIEDDTGGIVVLRNSRVAFARPGDRVRVEIIGLAQFFGSPEQRAVVISSVEVLEQAASPVLYENATSPFTVDMVARTHRIEGFVAQAPTDQNFNAMVISNVQLPPVESFEGATPVCLETCAGSCRQRCPSDDNSVCANEVCPAICAGGAAYNAALVPSACWSVAIEAELGRRGLQVPQHSHVAITAPVVGGFGGLQMWIVRLGQLEFLR